MSVQSLRTRNRLTGWTPVRRDAFLEALAETGSAERAAVRVGMSVSTAYRLRKQPRGAIFALSWDAVVSTRRGQLKEELLARVNGVPKPVYYRGRVIGEKVVASNRLLLGVLARTTRHQAATANAEEVYFTALARLTALKVNESADLATIP